MEKEKKKHKFKTLDLVYVGLSAALISVCAWITVPLTVPITLQTLGVCLVAGLFGAKKGTFSVIIYILLGAVGVPVFSGFRGGMGVIAGSTGGYMLGFVFTALIVGIVCDKTSKLWAIALAMAGGVLLCYVFGTAWFSFVYARDNSPAALKTILGWCVFPFIIPDIIKIALAAILTKKLKRFIK